MSETAAQQARPGPATSKEQRPTLGRIVIYNSKTSALCPAIVQALLPDGRLRLFVIGPRGYMIEENIEQGNGLNEWSWPERV